MGRVFRNEFRLMLHDAGVLLFFVALPLLYPIVYTLDLSGKRHRV